MSNSKDNRNDLTTPTLTEIENLLSNTKPRPTARLRHLVSDSPWQTQGREINMNRLKRLEFVVTGAAILLLALVAAVFFLEWPPAADSTNNVETAPLSSTRPAAASPTATPTEEAEPVEAAELIWMVVLPEEAGEEPLPATGIAYGELDGNGRLFIANGRQGIQRFSQTGEDLGPLSILDPATNQPVFVRDVAWSRLLWLGPPEFGLIALTDPFESGQYLHVVDADQGTIISSFEINNNIALPVNAPTITATVPTQLTATGEGEIYTDRIFAFPEDSAPDEPNALHYLLRMILDGRILNSILVSEQPAADDLASVISALAYQPTTSHLYAAVDQGDYGIVERYNLVGTPQKVAALDQEVVRWQEDVALTTDNQGHVYILVDNPGYIIELDQDDQIVNMYGFSDMADADYPAVFGRFPGSIGRPLALAVTPDGSMLFVVDQKEGQINLTAFALN